VRRTLVAFGAGVLSALILALSLWLLSSQDQQERAKPAESAAPQPTDAAPILRGASPAHGSPREAAPVVHVRDADSHEGLDGALLRILPIDSGHAVPAEDVFTLQADTHGVIAVPPERWQEERAWVFSAHGYLPTTMRTSMLTASAVGGAVTLDLRRGSRVAGRVVTPWGAPVADADVVGYGRYGVDFDGTGELLLPGPQRAGEVLRTRSDSEGRFNLSGIGAFPIRIQASKPGFAWKTDPEQDQLFVDRATDHVRLVLRPRLVAGLRVLDKLTGAIIHDFSVRTGRSEGPLTGRSEASLMRPGTVSDLGFSFREGEWWLVGCSSDSATGADDSARVFAMVRAPGYDDVKDVLLHVRPLDASGPPSPTIVHMTPTKPVARGLLRVQVVAATADLSLPWANIRIEELISDVVDSREPLAWTFRVELDEDGRAQRALRLPVGDYRVRVGKGTGWATWHPSSDDPWETVAITDSQSEAQVWLRYRAALLRISASLTSGKPIGMFNLMVHDVSPPSPEGHRPVAPMVAYLSDDNERWWLEYGHPYRSHLRMEPGALDLLLPPGRYFVKVTKTGFSDPEPEDVHLVEGAVVPIAFRFRPVPQGDDR
jgi:hypothetical protein